MTPSACAARGRPNGSRPVAAPDPLGSLPLDQVGPDAFRAGSGVHIGDGRMFGGELVAQTLRAAMATVGEAQHAHSLHAYYLRPGRAGESFDIEVDRVREGRSFSTRTMTVRQDGRAILSMTASFHVDEPGADAAMPMPAPMPAPPDLPVGRQPPGAPTGPPPPGATRHVWDTMQLVPVPDPVAASASNDDPPGEDPPGEDPAGDGRAGDASDPGAYGAPNGGGGASAGPTRRAWVRLTAPAPADRRSRAFLVTYLSDIFPLDCTAGIAGGWPNIAVGTSLDHTLWFHRDAALDGWMLFDLRTVSLGGARGLALATLHSADGLHLASFGQETLVRPRRAG